MIKRKTKNPKTTKLSPKIHYPDDRVKRYFKADKPNELWVSDITYVLTKSGYCYTAFITDVFSNTIASWMVSKYIDTKLVLDALDMAICTRKVISDNLVHHSDRNSQYFSDAYREKLDSELIIQSVSTTGDSYDNALAENLWSLLKRESGYSENFESIDEARASIFEWIILYNNERIHTSIENMPPAKFEQQFANMTENKVA
jgi:putative transposase